MASPGRQEVKVCACCQKSLKGQQVIGIERRQVYDIPPLELIITEHQAQVKRCTCGHINRADFPAGVDHHVQYGPNIKGLLVYMQDYQLLPYERTKEFVKDLLGHQLSAGTLYNVRSSAFEQLASFEERLKAVLTAAVVAGFSTPSVEGGLLLFRLFFEIWSSSSLIRDSSCCTFVS